MKRESGKKPPMTPSVAAWHKASREWGETVLRNTEADPEQFLEILRAYLNMVEKYHAVIKDCKKIFDDFQIAMDKCKNKPAEYAAMEKRRKTATELLSKKVEGEIDTFVNCNQLLENSAALFNVGFDLIEKCNTVFNACNAMLEACNVMTKAPDVNVRFALLPPIRINGDPNK